ncbi:MAG: ComEC/Rec2 family competence protein [Rhodobacteraceae bacterium]|nr:ComEC/Rec2 family competence protein [Paracoccaceae bacterium]
MQWLDSQRQNLMLWSPVVMACGVGAYFALPFEPPLWAGWALLASLVSWLGLAIWTSGFVRLLFLTVFFLNLGYLASIYRSASVAAPVLTFRYYGPIEGRVVAIDRSSSKALRITLDRVYLERVHKTPAMVRVSLFGTAPEMVLGSRVALVGSLSPPGGPVEPGGFDFRRYAWFDRLGAVGYSRNPVVMMRPYADAENGLWLDTVRRGLATFVAESIGGQNGAFAAAIITGERSRIDGDVLQTLRDSNLAHLLAISGLHMGLLTGFIFLLVRHGLALWPRLALRIPVKKIGALAALAAGFAYLFLSGGNVATQRAFIMAAVVLFAVLLDRPAFSLRAVALAALLVLLMRPESLGEAGFQMSFAATTALVGVFEMLRTARWWQWVRDHLPRRLMPVFTLLLTSAIAGGATAPIAAFHFNQISNFGLAANLLSVPLMGMVVMPAAVIALLLSPFGLGSWAFWLMGKGVGWILGVAAYFSEIENAVTMVPTGPPVVLPLIGLSGCFLFILLGRARVAGIALFSVAISLWVQSERPTVLINSNASLLGVMTPTGRALNKETAYRFAAGIWLENDGDPANQQAAFSRAGMITESRLTRASLPNGWTLLLNQNKEINAALCTAHTILIAPKWETAPAGNCLFIGKLDVESLSGFAITFENDEPVVTSAMPRLPLRPWTNGGAPYQ